jgi:predicted molibdopterin-dependent oxidoreductase YjgC
VAAVTGVEAETIVKAARQLAGHTPTIIIYGSGVTHHPTALNVIKAIRHLASLLDDAGIMGVSGEGNFVGAHDMGLHPALLPGYRLLSDPKAQATFETAWKTTLNVTPGRDYGAILDGVRQGQIKALYLAGEVSPLPELSDLPFLIVQDILATENVQYADVVLPATTFAEMNGTLTNLEGRVQRLRQAIQPVGLSHPGWMIVHNVAQQMSQSENGRGAGQWEYASAAAVMAEIATIVPAYAAVSYETLDESGVLRRFELADKEQPLPFTLDDIPQFASDEFPLTLITERNLFYYHGACLTEQVKGMNLIKQEEILHLNPVDASRLGITDGALVKAVSPYGSVECIVEVKNELPQGAAFASFNRVTGSPLFPTLAPSSKAYAIRIEGR